MPARFAIGALFTAAIIACAKTAESAPANTAAGATTAAAFGPDSMPLVMDTALLRAADMGRIAGDSTAKLVVLEISDFQCPYCKTFHDSTYSALRAAYIDNGKARLAYVHLPLRMHANAWPAAEAAMCASVQNRFWPMHDSLFNSQKRWESITRADTMFTRFATSLQLNLPKYASCMTSHATRPLIQSDAERSASAGVTATPTFIIGDSALSGAYPFPDFRRMIDANLATRARR
jgi:protein-disulfide isomerase